MKQPLGIIGAVALTVGLIGMTPTVAQAETSSSSPTVKQSSTALSVVPRNIKRNKKRCVYLGRYYGTGCNRYPVNTYGGTQGLFCYRPDQFGYNSSGIYICVRDGFSQGLNMWMRY